MSKATANLISNSLAKLKEYCVYEPKISESTNYSSLLTFNKTAIRKADVTILDEISKAKLAHGDTSTIQHYFDDRSLSLLTMDKLAEFSNYLNATAEIHPTPLNQENIYALTTKFKEEIVVRKVKTPISEELDAPSSSK